MIRPWYRSLAFYLGIPGLMFLLWGWLADPFLYRSARFTLGEYCLTLSDAGSVGRVSWEVYGSGRLMAPGMNLHSYRAGGAWTMAQPEHQFFPPALSYVVNEYDYHLGRRSIPQLSLAHWFLISLYLPAWGTLLVAWHRRKGRLMKATGLG